MTNSMIFDDTFNDQMCHQIIQIINNYYFGDILWHDQIDSER